MDAVRQYLSNTSVNAPFFLIVGDGNYASIKTQLAELGLKFVKLSDCCAATDKPPSIDRLLDTFAFADIDGNSNDKKIVVVGLGEYLALRGESEAFKRLDSIKDIKIGNARVVLLLRSVSSVVRKIQHNERSRSVDRYMFFTDNTESDINITIVPGTLNLPASNGVKGLLAELENGETVVNVKTNANFDNSLFTVSKINSAFDGIKHIRPTFSLAESLGTNEQWTDFLTALNVANGEINTIVAEYGSKPEHELSKWIVGTAYKNWLYFILLKLKSSEIDNSYLKYVVETTDNFAELKKNILCTIIVVVHTDNRFARFFDERNEIIARLLADKKVTDSDIADFILENRRNLDEVIFNLTSRTLRERKEFVSLFSLLDKQTIINRASSVYNALADYLWAYTFTDPKVSVDLNTLLTSYFDRYKWQKVLNTIDVDFLEQVESLANERKYNELRTRAEVLSSITNKDDTYLYWVDALGVEFLGVIQKLCEKKGLSLRIHIAQAYLPTITSVNKSFYDDWAYGKKEKESRLDELKHKKSGGYNYETERLPVHLAEELDIIESVIESASVQLTLHHVKKVLIVSDHGASRLAVINEQEEKYENDTKGEHGGRCSKRPADYTPNAYDLPFATESSDGQYLVLANYGRFKGSRKANIEVHGGATLEEVVVPIVEIMLANPDTSIEVIDSDKIYASFRKPLQFTVFSKTELQSVRVVVIDVPTPFIANKTGKNHYIVTTDIKRPGKYHADVFDGDSLVGKIILDVQSETQKKSGSENFDNLFD